MKSLTQIESALRSRDEETRRGALQALRGRPLQDTREHLFYAMGDESWRVRKEAVDVFVAEEPDELSIEALFELLRDQENAGARNTAAEALSRLGSRAMFLLKRLAGDNDADVRKFVIDVMGTIGNPEFVPVLLSSLDDRDVNVASAAAEHLGNIGDSRSVPELIQAIVANDSVLFRFSALAALGKLNSHLHVPDEIIALADQDILRKGVYDSLGSIGDESVSPILLQGFLSRQKSSRRAAVHSWYRIFARSSATARMVLEESLRKMADSEAVPTLIDLFDISDSPLAEAVTVLLGVIGDMRGAKTLLSAYASERLSGIALASLKRLGASGMEALVALYPQVDETSRCAICTVVGELGYRDGGTLICEALRDSSPQVRKAAVSAAGRLNLTDCLPDIVGLLDDTDFEVRICVTACLQALALIDRNAIQAVARQISESDKPEQRRDAVILHAALGDGERLSLLVKDENAGVRRAAVSAMGKMRLSEVDGNLLLALVDEDPEVRIAAAETLGRIGGQDVLDPLNHALNDEDIWVQCAVLRSIAQIDKSHVLPAIRSVFSSADGLLMITCLDLLESIGSREAMDIVEAALASQDCEIVSMAISILVRQGGEWVSSHAERLISHPNEEVREVWAGVLADLPPRQARRFLSHALKTEQSSRIRVRIQGLLEGIA